MFVCFCQDPEIEATTEARGRLLVAGFHVNLTTRSPAHFSRQWVSDWVDLWA